MSIFFRTLKPRGHDDTVTVKTTLTTIVGPSRKRISVIAVNMSNTTVTFTRNPAGDFNHGLQAEQFEGYEWNIYRGDDVTDAIFAIVASGTATVCFEEELDRAR